MAITQAMCTSFKKELLEGGHNFAAAGGNTFNLALFRDTGAISGTFGAATTNYSEMGVDEVTGTGYVAGGLPLVNAGIGVDGTVAFADFNNLTFSTVTLVTRGALIYNTNLAGASNVVLDFGSDKAATAGDLVIQFPSPTGAAATIRLA